MSRRRIGRRLLAVLLLLGLPWLLLRLWPTEQIAALVLNRLARGSGLDLRTTAPSRLGLLPDFHLELSAVSVAGGGQAEAFASARHVQAALPLQALWSDSARPGAIRVEGLQLDVPALSRWRASLRDLGPMPPPRLPRLSATITLTDTRIALAGNNLHAPHIEFSPCRPDRRCRLNALFEMTAGLARLPLAVQLVATPKTIGDGLRLQTIDLQIAAGSAATTSLQLGGELEWVPPARLRLDTLGSVGELPAAWPLPDSLRKLIQLPALIGIRYNGAADFSGEIQLRWSGIGQRLSATTSLSALLADPLLALSDPTQTQLHFEAPRLEWGALRIEALRIESAPVPTP